MKDSLYWLDSSLRERGVHVELFNGLFVGRRSLLGTCGRDALRVRALRVSGIAQGAFGRCDTCSFIIPVDVRGEIASLEFLYVTMIWVRPPFCGAILWRTYLLDRDLSTTLKGRSIKLLGQITVGR